MSNYIQRDKGRRLLFNKLEKKRLHYKCVIRNLSLPINVRSTLVSFLNKLNRNSALVRARNRCVLSGRGRGVHKFSKLSRIKLRELVNQGLLLGLCKSSW